MMPSCTEEASLDLYNKFSRRPILMFSTTHHAQIDLLSIAPPLTRHPQNPPPHPSPQTNHPNPTAPATDPTTTTHPETATSLFVTPLANFQARNLNEFSPWNVKIHATPNLTADFTIQGREPKDAAMASAERSRPSPRCVVER
jgi:hypothetical protein